MAFVCLASVSASFGQQTFVGLHGRLTVKGNKIVDKDGAPTTLHGMSMYCWASQGTQFYNAGAVNHLAQDWKCTVIRIPVLPRAFKRNPTIELNKVETVMDACISNGIYAIVDWHSMGGAQTDVAASQAFFSTLADAYGKTPNIMYEPWNEPEHESWPVIKAYHEEIISAIRAIRPGKHYHLRQQELGPAMRRSIPESHHEFIQHRLFGAFLCGITQTIASGQRIGGASKRRRSVRH